MYQVFLVRREALTAASSPRLRLNTTLVHKKDREYWVKIVLLRRICEFRGSFGQSGLFLRGLPQNGNGRNLLILKCLGRESNPHAPF